MVRFKYFYLQKLQQYRLEIIGICKKVLISKFKVIIVEIIFLAF